MGRLIIGLHVLKGGLWCGPMADETSNSPGATPTPSGLILNTTTTGLNTGPDGSNITWAAANTPVASKPSAPGESNTPASIPKAPVTPSVPQDFFGNPTDLIWAVSDPTRWKVLRALAGGYALCVQDLCGVGSRTNDQMSKHLKYLREAGAIVPVPSPDGDGRKQHYIVPQKFGRTDEFGKPMLDYGVCVLRFP